MKKLAVFVLSAMVFISAVCAFQGKAEAAYAGASEMSKWTSNPWVDSDRGEVFRATGFDLGAPAEACNVAYSYMPDTGMAQMNYTMENAMWIYRMQPSDALTDISDIHCDWNYAGETRVAGMDAIEYSYASEFKGDNIVLMECVRVIAWYDAQNKVTYSLSVLGPDLNGMDIAVYAEDLFNGPKSDGIAPVDEKVSREFRESDLYKSYLGLHVNDYDGSDILVEEDEETGRLKVSVSLFRLCSLDDGTGNYENGFISFDSTDPSGELIRCSLYFDMNNSLCLEIEESTWEYLPSGTVISGFDN